MTRFRVSHSLLARTELARQSRRDSRYGDYSHRRTSHRAMRHRSPVCGYGRGGIASRYAGAPMIRYRMSPRLTPTLAGGTSNGRRPKPLYGARKYDRAVLACHTPKCDSDYFVSIDGRRYCHAHWTARNRRPVPDSTRRMLVALGMRPS